MNDTQMTVEERYARRLDERGLPIPIVTHRGSKIDRQQAKAEYKRERKREARERKRGQRSMWVEEVGPSSVFEIVAPPVKLELRWLWCPTEFPDGPPIPDRPSHLSKPAISRPGQDPLCGVCGATLKTAPVAA